MPELPEVETVRRTLLAPLQGRTIARVDVRETRLRYPLDPRRLRRHGTGHPIETIERRGKYLIFVLRGGHRVLVHLGMSGRLSLVAADTPPATHDHVLFRIPGFADLRFHDPRRFGWVEGLAAEEVADHRLLRHLGVEPLSTACTGAYLHGASRGRRIAVKSFLMDARIVVGVGNIYASEVLHRAGINPGRAAGRTSAASCDRLAAAIGTVLSEAVEGGGTTLNDFRSGTGHAGSFQSRLRVYGREGSPCPRCSTPIRRRVQGARSTYDCPRCQR